jgi:hypothetical protein
MVVSMAMRKAEKPVDANMHELVDTLKRFPGLSVTASCGGHAEPGETECALGEFYATCAIEHSEDGWISAEFLAWAVNHDLRSTGRQLLWYCISGPPWHGLPGTRIRFTLAGTHGEDPQQLGLWLEDMRVQHYISRSEMQRPNRGQVSDGDDDGDDDSDNEDGD